MLHVINEAYKHCKTIGAISKGVDLLMESSLKESRLAEDNKGELVEEYGIISMRRGSDLNTYT